jgi:hypothetical protein
LIREFENTFKVLREWKIKIVGVYYNKIFTVEKMTPDELMKIYPQLDYLMAETLLIMSREKKLETYMESETDPKTSENIIIGAISISEKSDVGENKNRKVV